MPDGQTSFLNSRPSALLHEPQRPPEIIEIIHVRVNYRINNKMNFQNTNIMFLYYERSFTLPMVAVRLSSWSEPTPVWLGLLLCSASGEREWESERLVCLFETLHNTDNFKYQINIQRERDWLYFLKKTIYLQLKSNQVWSNSSHHCRNCCKETPMWNQLIQVLC